MSRTLQQRMIKAKTTFPVVAVFALLFWCVGVEWPLDSQVTLSGWWGAVIFPAWVMEGINLLLCLLALYLLAELNNAYSLVGRRGMLHGLFFLLFWTSVPFASHCVEANLTLCCLLGSMGSLFKSFQQRHASAALFSMFLFLGLGSMVCLPVLGLVPLLYVATWYFQSLTVRSFFAGLMGLAWPYWVLFVYAFCVGRLEVFADLFRPFFPSLLSGYAVVSPISWMLWSVTLLLFFGCLGYVLYHYGRYKIRTRLFLIFILWWTFSIAVLWVLVPMSSHVLSPLLYASAGLLAGHLFSFSFTRVSNICFLVVLLFLVALSVYSCVWMLW